MPVDARISKKIKRGSLTVTVEAGTVKGETGATRNGWQGVAGPFKVKIENLPKRKRK